MARLAHKSKEPDLGAIASLVLKKTFNGSEVSEVAAVEERDFDGTDILRVSARVAPAITATQLGDAISDLRAAFADEGFDHFVVLSIKDAGEDLSDVEE